MRQLDATAAGGGGVHASAGWIMLAAAHTGTHLNVLVDVIAHQGEGPPKLLCGEEGTAALGVSVGKVGALSSTTTSMSIMAGCRHHQ